MAQAAAGSGAEGLGERRKRQLPHRRLAAPLTSVSRGSGTAASPAPLRSLPRAAGEAADGAGRGNGRAGGSPPLCARTGACARRRGRRSPLAARGGRPLCPPTRRWLPGCQAQLGGLAGSAGPGREQRATEINMFKRPYWELWRCPRHGGLCPRCPPPRRALISLPGHRTRVTVRKMGPGPGRCHRAPAAKRRHRAPARGPAGLWARTGGQTQPRGPWNGGGDTILQTHCQQSRTYTKTCVARNSHYF